MDLSHCIYTYIHTYIYMTLAHAPALACACARIRTHIHMYVCMYVCTCVCICIYIYANTDEVLFILENNYWGFSLTRICINMTVLFGHYQSRMLKFYWVMSLRSLFLHFLCWWFRPCYLSELEIELSYADGRLIFKDDKGWISYFLWRLYKNARVQYFKFSFWEIISIALGQKPKGSGSLKLLIFIVYLVDIKFVVWKKMTNEINWCKPVKWRRWN